MHRKTVERGSVLILVTLGLIAMCGLMGLAVDLGWSYYTRESAQAAADSAALAAVVKAKSYGQTQPFSCDQIKMACSATPTPCSSIAATSNLHSACQYAQQNGFQDGVGKVKVTVAADVTSPAPTVPGVTVFYWVTVRVNQQIPQLFSAVLGNTSGLVSARATGALTNVVFKASLDLLNRQNDPSTVMGTGIDLKQQGGGTITSPGGMFLASTNPGAASFGGSANVTSTPFSWFRGSGTCLESNGKNCITDGKWQQPWTNGHSDGMSFWDPTAGKGQPPLYTGGTTDQVVDSNTNNGRLGPSNPPGVTGNGTKNNPYILPPGSYYSATCTGGGANRTCTPTGAQIQFDSAYYQFGNGGATFPTSNQWVFFGGLTTTGGNSTITFSPGRYVFAGTTSAKPQFNIDNGTTIQDTYTGTNYPGEIFLYTNSHYSTSHSSLSVPSALSNIQNTFQYGETGIKTGNNPNSSINLHGLDPVNAPAELQGWAPFLMWQDRGDSTVAYTPETGDVVTTSNGPCPPGTAAETGQSFSPLDIACTKPSPNPNAPQMSLQATPQTHLSGAVYQPRGAWLTLQGGGLLQGPLQIITGALNNAGGGNITLQGISNPITILATALIE